jgi:hypothetical protein
MLNQPAYIYIFLAISTIANKYYVLFLLILKGVKGFRGEGGVRGRGAGLIFLYKGRWA